MVTESERLIQEGLRVELRPKKVLVTGADGFIGSHLTEELV